MPTLGEAVELARRLAGEGRFSESLELYRQITAAVPHAAEIWHEAGLIHLQASQPSAAVELLAKAVALAPDNGMFHSNLGAAYRALGQTARAIASFRSAIAASPSAAEAHNNLALALKVAGQHDAALAEFDAAVRLRPDYVNGWFNRGNLLRELGRFDAAIESYRTALSHSTVDPGIVCQLGVAQYDCAQYEAALASFETALALDPHYPEAHRNRALVWLARGDFQRGWREFEWRTACNDFISRAPQAPRWDGSPLDGRRLLVYHEQGLGDSLQFVRYLPLVERAGGIARLEVQSALKPLVAASGFGQFLQSEQDTLPDFECPLMSLAAHLPNASGQPYWPGPYLSADPVLVADWHERLCQRQAGFRVGIAWAGNPAHPHDRFRSVPLEAFAPLARIADVQLVSLQIGDAREQLKQSPLGAQIIDLGPDLDQGSGAFMDTAAVLKSLDLVISVDTAIVHLAGGMNAPVWVPLHFSPDWRWQVSGETTPWYPSVRLFRQSGQQDWSTVFEQLAAELSKRIAGRAG
ncbi:MAG TPA: tetratricopeptide repeat-containing glycosyltransferase family protein [Pirellulales bacterium]